MRGAERVVFALRALGEAGEAAALAQRTDARAPAGEDLVRIGLMADVPDQPVARRVEHVVQCNRQLDDAEAGAEMAAGHRHRADRLGAQLVGQLSEIAGREAAQVFRRLDLVRIGQTNRHFPSPSLRGDRLCAEPPPELGAQINVWHLFTLVKNARNNAPTTVYN